ncbi:GGDEF domain-containing protein [Meiothermus rufus]|uniref:GGDEF domain-containing protein n=1 Tax=Meiothermus rufus TaxID=604332 RepID=UPI0004055D12|nr:GGDEF domain-containing protein [Meiothermus rufus]
MGEALLLRLMLLQEAAVGWVDVPFAELPQQAARAATWIFPRAHLHALAGPPPSPLHTGRMRLEPWGLVYAGYHPGPPHPVLYALEGPDLNDPTELRLAALFMEHFLTASRAAGYREELERQARTDWLTGAGNRRAFERALQGLSPGWGLIVVDVDGLKAINDTQGHHAGDRHLREIARQLQAVLLQGGLYRVGGDEFALLFPLEELGLLEATLPQLPVSWGLARGEEATGEALYHLADQRMYAMKAGRKGTT